MWCRRVRSQLSAYVDGELSAAERSAVAEHLSRCEVCSAERESLTKLTRITSLIPEEDLPSGLHSRIMSRLAYAETPPVPARSTARRNQPFGPLVWTAVAGATATVAFAYVQGRTVQPSVHPAHSSVTASRGTAAQPHAAQPAPLAPRQEEPISSPIEVRDRPAEGAALCEAPAPEPIKTANGRSISARDVRTVRKADRDDAADPAGPLVRELQPQPLAVTTPSGKPAMEMRAIEPSPPAVASPEILGMPGDPIVNTTGQGQPLGTEPLVAMEKDAGMRMAGSMPVEEQIEGEEDEGLRSLRMFLEERNRTVPQPPALDLSRPRRNRKSL